MRVSKIFLLIQNISVLTSFIFLNFNIGGIILVFLVANTLPVFSLMHRFSRLIRQNEYVQRYMKKMSLPVSLEKLQYELFHKPFLFLFVEILLVLILLKPDIIQVLPVLVTISAFEILRYFFVLKHIPDPEAPLNLKEFSKIFLNPALTFSFLVSLPVIILIIFTAFYYLTYYTDPVNYLLSSDPQSNIALITGLFLMSIKILFDWYSSEDMYIKTRERNF